MTDEEYRRRQALLNQEKREYEQSQQQKTRTMSDAEYQRRRSILDSRKNGVINYTTQYSPVNTGLTSGMDKEEQDYQNYMAAYNHQSMMNPKNMSQEAVQYRSKWNADNLEKMKAYEDEKKRNRQLKAAAGSTTYGAAGQVVKKTWGESDAKLREMEEQGYDKAYIDVNNYRRSGQDVADKYHYVQDVEGFSAAEKNYRGSTSYDVTRDALGLWEMSKANMDAAYDEYMQDQIGRADLQAAAMGIDASGKIAMDGVRKGYQYMTADERNTYYSLLSGNEASAAQYLDDLTLTLQRRASETNTFYNDEMEDLTFGQRLAGDIMSVPASVMGGVPAFIDDAIKTIRGEEINPYDSAHVLQNQASLWRARHSEYIDNETGANDNEYQKELRHNEMLKKNAAAAVGTEREGWYDGRIAYSDQRLKDLEDAGLQDAAPIDHFMTWGDAYQALMSSADSMFGSVFGGTGYGLMMGTGAASSTAKDLYEQGANSDEIAWASLAAGAAEGIFEKYSIEFFTDKITKYGAKNVWEFIRNLALQGVAEGSEEFATEVANTITGALFAYDFSDWAKDKAAYTEKHPGATESEAFWGTVLSSAYRATKAGAAGTLSGMFMGATGSAAGAIENRNIGNALLNSNQARNVIEGANEVRQQRAEQGGLMNKLDNAVTSKTATDLTQKLENDTLSSKDAAGLGQMYRLYEEGMRDADIGKIEAGVKGHLEEIGAEGDIDTIAKAVAKQQAGEKLNMWEKDALTSDAAKQVLKELDDYAPELENRQREADRLQRESLQAEENTKAANANVERALNRVVETDYQDASAKQAYADATDQAKAAKATEETAVAAAKAARTAVTDYVNDESRSWVSKLGTRLINPEVFSSNDIHTQAKTFSFDQKAQKLFENYHQEGQDVRGYANDFGTMYVAGASGANMENIQAKYVDTLTDVQAQAAYQAGQTAAREHAYDVIKNQIYDGGVKNGEVSVRESGQRNDGTSSGEQVQPVAGSTGSTAQRGTDSAGQGAVVSHFGEAGKYVVGQKISASSIGQGTDTNSNFYVVGAELTKETMAAKAEADKRGVGIVFYYAENPDRHMRGRHGAFNGVYDPSTNTIFVQVNDPTFTSEQIVKHEFTHDRIAKGELDMKAVFTEATQDLTEEGRKQMIQDYRDALFGLGNLSDAYIMEEIVADAVGGMNKFADKAEQYQKVMDRANALADKTDATVAAATKDQTEKGHGAAQSTVYDQTSILGAVVDDTNPVLNPAIEPSTDISNVSDVSRYSYVSLAQAAGFDAIMDETGLHHFVRNGNKVETVTVDDIENSPIGALINYSMDMGDLGKVGSKEAKAAADAQKKFFADICTLAAKVNDFNMGMQFAGSSVFMALKANADKQYGTTYDFPSICTKTQALIDSMSAAMVEAKRGLEAEEVELLAEKVFYDGNPIPCPECYVFSHWIGIGGLLDNINKYQERFGNMDAAAVEAEYQKMYAQIDAFSKENGLTIGKAKGKLAAKFTKEYRRVLDDVEKKQNQGEKVSEKRLAELQMLEGQMETVKAMTWIDSVYFKDSAHKKVNPRRNVPVNVLFDLNQGEAFASEYPEAWAFRTTQGAGYGKAITPYADAVLGEGILGTANLSATTKAKKNGSVNNPFLNQRKTLDAEAKKILARARQKQKNQAFLGGQRFQSTSDALYENATDYLLAFLEVQAMHGMVQVYTKVPGAVPAFAVWGASTNQSLMPKGSGLDANGNPIDTDTGGMNPKIAKKNRLDFDSQGTITIGVNDNHIRKLFNQHWRDFIIPYHASGGKANIVNWLRGIQDNGQLELTRSTDYTNTQGDKVLSDEVLRWQGRGDEIDRIHDLRAARIAILTRTNPNMEVVRSNRFLSELYDRLNGGEWDGVKLAKGTISDHIFPNEFWDQSVGYADSGKITQDYLEYCHDLGFLHRFSGMRPSNGILIPVNGYNETGAKVPLQDLAYKYKDGQKTDEIEPFFWKVLTDRRMYDNKGNYLPQKYVNITNTTTDTLTEFAQNGRYTTLGYDAGRQYNAKISQETVKEITPWFADGSKASTVAESTTLSSESDKANAGADLRIMQDQKNTFADRRAGENVKYSVVTDGTVFDPLRNEDGSIKYVYKAFYAMDGKLYPPMVSNLSDEQKKSVKGAVSGTMRSLDTPVGVWLRADVGTLGRYKSDATEYDVQFRKLWSGKSKEVVALKEALKQLGIDTKTPEGKAYAMQQLEQVVPKLKQASKENLAEKAGELVRNSAGRLAVENAKGGDVLAFRPGWHLGEWPDAKQFNKDSKLGKRSVMPDGLVFAKCEIAGGKDYQLDAMSYGVKKNGKYDRTQAGLPTVPENGYYKYRTNPDPKTAPWYITGAMRVVEILDDDDCARTCAEYGVKADPRESFQKIDLAKYGLKRGPVTAPENLKPYEKSQQSYKNDADLKAALEDPNYADAYVKGRINFDDPEILKEFERNGQDAAAYKKKYNANMKESLYSNVSDTEGNELSEQQAEYFKDSKVRDENGNLMVMYHGSGDAGFHVFNPRKSDDHRSLFFTNKLHNAASYSGRFNEYAPSKVTTVDAYNKATEGTGYSIKNLLGRYQTYYNGDYVAEYDSPADAFSDWLADNVPNQTNYKVYLNVTDPLIIDANGAPWDEIRWQSDRYKEAQQKARDQFNLAKEYKRNGDSRYVRAYEYALDLQSKADDLGEAEGAFREWNTREISEKAYNDRHDGVIIRNVVDYGDAANVKTDPATVVIAFDGNQAKSVANTEPTSNPDIRYSIVTEGPYKYVKADRQVITGDDPAAWQRQIEGYINDVIRGGEDVVFPTSDGHILILTGRTAYKLSDPHTSSVSDAVRNLLSDEDFARKGRMVTHIDELIQVAKFRRYRADVDNKHANDIGEDGFNYYNSFFMDADGTYYLVPLSAGINGSEETAYSIGTPEIRKAPTSTGSSSNNGGAQKGGSSSAPRLAYSTQKSQEVNDAIRIAYDKALAKQKGSNSSVSEVNIASADMEAFTDVHRLMNSMITGHKGDTAGMKAAIQEAMDNHDSDLWNQEGKAMLRAIDKYDGKLTDIRKDIAARASEIKLAVKAQDKARKESSLREAAIEREFMRLLNEYEKADDKATTLGVKLAQEARKHKEDNAIWEREFRRMERLYEQNGRSVEKLTQALKERRQKEKAKVEGRRRTELRNKIQKMYGQLKTILDNPSAPDTKHAPRELIRPLAEFCRIFAMHELDYRNQQETAAQARNNSQKRLNQIQNAKRSLTDLITRYEGMQGSDGVMGAAYSQEAVDMLHDLSHQMDEWLTNENIHEMSSEDLRVVYDTMKKVMHEIVDANRLRSMAKNATLSDVAGRWYQQMNEATSVKSWLGKHKQLYDIWQMRPDNFFQYTCGFAKGNVGEDISRMLWQGNLRMLEVQRDYADLFNPIINQSAKAVKEIKAMTDPKKLVPWGLKDSAGNEVETTRGMMLSAYKLLSQDDSLESLAYGGFKLPNMHDYYTGHIDAAYGGAEMDSLLSATPSEDIGELQHQIRQVEMAMRDGEIGALEGQLMIDDLNDQIDSLVAGEKMRLLEMKATIEGMLTPLEKQLLEASDEWMAHTGNLVADTFYDLNGYDMKRVENYWTIHRDTTTISSLDTVSVVNEYNLANSGMTKERVHARNPILLTDFFQELNSSQRKVSRYVGFALAQKDFNKIWKMKAAGKRFSIEGLCAAKFQTGSHKFGRSGTEYVENFIRDISGTSNSDDGIMSGLYSAAAGATLSANIRVALSQLASLPTAASEVGWTNMTKGVLAGLGTAASKKARDNLAKENVLFWQRYKGEGSTTEVADLMKSGGLWGNIAGSKVGKALFNWCQEMDVLATGPMMWKMAESAVKSTGMKESDEGFQAAVNEKYTAIIRKTQPNYTETERSDLLRDKRTSSKILTMYKTQSNQNLNILMEANMRYGKMVRDLKAGKNGVTKADVDAARKQLFNAYTGVVIGGTLAFAFIRFLGNAIQRTMNSYRDDDTNEVTTEAAIEGIMKDAASSAAGMFALGGNIYDLLYSSISGDKYYGMSDSALGMLSDSADALYKFTSAMHDGDMNKIRDKGLDFMKKSLMIAGVPTGNIEKIVNMASGWYGEIRNGNLFEYEGKTTSTQYRNRYVDAALSGDTEKTGALTAMWLAESKESDPQKAAKGVQSDMTSYLKKRYDKDELSGTECVTVMQSMGISTEDAAQKVANWEFKLNNNGSNLSDTAISIWNMNRDIPLDVFEATYQYHQEHKKKDDLIKYIQSLRISDTMKRKLWNALKGQWKDKGTPWE